MRSHRAAERCPVACGPIHAQGLAIDAGNAGLLGGLNDVKDARKRAQQRASSSGAGGGLFGNVTQKLQGFFSTMQGGGMGSRVKMYGVVMVGDSWVRRGGALWARLGLQLWASLVEGRSRGSGKAELVYFRPDLARARPKTLPRQRCCANGGGRWDTSSPVGSGSVGRTGA